MFQVSLRWLLVLVSLIAIAIVSLRLASAGWVTAVLTVVFLSFWAAFIIAVVGSGERRAFAIGFAVTVISYGIIIDVVPREPSVALINEPFWTVPEFNPDTGRLPTTWLLAPLFHAMAKISWYDMTTGAPVPNPSNAEPNANISLSEIPDRWQFMVIGHLWWAMLLGLCGGWFARFVYLRRTLRDRSEIS